MRGNGTIAEGQRGQRCWGSCGVLPGWAPGATRSAMGRPRRGKRGRPKKTGRGTRSFFSLDQFTRTMRGGSPGLARSGTSGRRPSNTSSPIDWETVGILDLLRSALIDTSAPLLIDITTATLFSSQNGISDPSWPPIWHLSCEAVAASSSA